MVNEGTYPASDAGLRNNLYMMLRDTCFDMNQDNTERLDQRQREPIGRHYSNRWNGTGRKFARGGPLAKYPIDSWEIRGTPQYTEFRNRIGPKWDYNYTDEDALPLDETTTSVAVPTAPPPAQPP